MLPIAFDCLVLSCSALLYLALGCVCIPVSAGLHTASGDPKSVGRSGHLVLRRRRRRWVVAEVVVVMVGGCLSTPHPQASSTQPLNQHTYATWHPDSRAPHHSTAEHNTGPPQSDPTFPTDVTEGAHALTPPQMPTSSNCWVSVQHQSVVTGVCWIELFKLDSSAVSLSISVWAMWSWKLFFLTF